MVTTTVISPYNVESLPSCPIFTDIVRAERRSFGNRSGITPRLQRVTTPGHSPCQSGSLPTLPCLLPPLFHSVMLPDHSILAPICLLH